MAWPVLELDKKGDGEHDFKLKRHEACWIKVGKQVIFLSHSKTGILLEFYPAGHAGEGGHVLKTVRYPDE